VQAKEYISEIIARLEQTYGIPQHGNKEDPLDELIYIKLSQQTNSPKFRSMYEALQCRYPGWHGLEKASLKDLEALLRPGGLAQQRARYLKDIAAQIVKDCGQPDLSWLRDVSPPDALTYLLSLPGIGLKTAYCVGMYALGWEVLPVDVHVQRISERLGLLPPSLSDKKKHLLLEEIIQPDKRYSYHVTCVSHGRAVCRKVPRCHICCIRDFCAFWAACGEGEAQLTQEWKGGKKVRK